METEVLVAHPHKHHAFNLAAGCHRTGRATRLAVPYYRKGLGALVCYAPGKIGQKANGYFHPALYGRAIHSPLTWQVRKLVSFFGGQEDIASAFDEYVASKLGRSYWKPKIVATLQDYMPLTVRAAKRSGALVWSDQILNQSDEAMERIALHYRNAGILHSQTHDERKNNEILGIADLITIPSRYCMDGIRERVSPSARCETIPYGVNNKVFNVKREKSEGEIVLVSTANSIRKGGHLLLKSLALCGDQLVLMADGRGVRVVIMGTLEPSLAALLDKLGFATGLTVVNDNFPHSEVPGLLASASLFVLPSLSEGMSLACAEAMQAGLPMIVTRYVGIDYFLPGEMGFQVEDTVDSLVNALTLAFQDRSRWPDWGGNCRNTVSNYSWDRYEHSIADVLARLD